MKPTIKHTILADRNVDCALQMLSKRMNDLDISQYKIQMELIEADYKLMCDCFKRGINDPKGGDIYDSLLRRTYRLYSNVRLASLVKNRLALAQCKSVVDNNDWQEDSIKTTLEAYVQDVAMASLLEGDEQEISLKKTHAAHQRYIDNLFRAIIVAKQWNDDCAHFYRSLLLSPTIDQYDSLLIVSALTIALECVFDPNKWLTLVEVYNNSNIQELRQRALVGIAITMPDQETQLFPQLKEAISKLCSSESTRKELVELQIQLLYCIRTESDSAEIQRDIMPALIKNNSFRVTRDGIEEKDDDTMDDILGNDSTERKIEEMEQNINRMREMEKKGSDIYFGGFAHMKRFSFFDQISNWFTPFYMEHPDVTNAVKSDKASMIEGVISHAPFCDSDKYSFAFALASVYDRLPDAVKEMLTQGSQKLIGSTTENDRNSSPYIRRMYLQNMYRFYNLYQDRNSFTNPFNNKDNTLSAPQVFFFANKNVSPLMGESRLDVARVLFKWKFYDRVVEVLNIKQSADDHAPNEEELLLLANSYQRMGDVDKAASIFKQMPQNRMALKGYAYTMFVMRKYQEAADIYSNLLNEAPDDKRMMLYNGLSLVNSGRQKEGMAFLFRLNYECPEDKNVMRALAWGHLSGGKPGEAERIYDLILEQDTTIGADLLNNGYAKWFIGKQGEAVELFKRYKEVFLKDNNKTIEEDFTTDSYIFGKYNVKDFEIKIMISLVEND